MDDDYPLPGLTAQDPQNLLSRQARVRISQARYESERIRLKAISDAEFSYKQLDESECEGLTEYLLKSSDYRTAALEGIRVVLRVMWDEYSAIGLPRRRLGEIMREEIDGAVNSYELSQADRMTFELEFSPYRIDGGPSNTRPPVEPDAAMQPVRARVESHVRKRYAGNMKAFAEKLGISRDTLYAVLKEARRCRDVVYIDMAGEIGCEPRDLYPKSDKF